MSSTGGGKNLKPGTVVTFLKEMLDTGPRIRVTDTKGGYDWFAYYHGNPIQKWWKRKTCAYVLRMVEGDPVVDLGCGSSPILSLAKAPVKLGIDIAEAKIQFMRRIDPTSEYRVGLAESTGLPDGFASTTLCIEVIEHHPQPHKLMQEIARITKKGGTAIISTPEFSSVLWNIIEVAYGILMRHGYHNEHGTKLTESGVKALAQAYGLTHVQTSSILGADKMMKFRKE